MSEYRYPHNDIAFCLKELVGFDELCRSLNIDDIDTDFAMSVLDEAAKLATDVLAPLNKVGDNQPARLEGDKVIESPDFAQAYAKYVEGGWASLTADEAYGGQNLPHVLGTAVGELWQSANLAFALCPLLGQGAIEAITIHGAEHLKEQYLAKLVSGEWSGTMNLTEPDAGTDLAAVKTKAVAEGDHYRITGQKIFITWGDHQMTDNIVHLVLARLPDAPAGVKGISLFVVPKYILDEQGNPGQPNDLRCVSLEHKMGIHGSPTCVMSYGDNGGAVGYLVGEPHQGLAYMFTMMNRARQDVGLQGLSISERAYQQAVVYAKERLQGTNKDGSRFTIINFPDVRRMLMQMKASIEAMRGLAYLAAADLDKAHRTPDQGQAAKYSQRVDLLTPIVKGWMTELAQEVTYLAVQVHGGMGFIEETGVAQYYRDARILTIYEGTTGIQALDLIGRKTLLNQGQYLTDYLAEITQTASELKASEHFAGLGDALAASVELASKAAQSVLASAPGDQAAAGAASVPFLFLLGYVSGAWVMGQSVLKAEAAIARGDGDADFLSAKQITAQYYFEHLLPRTKAYADEIFAGSSSMMSLREDQF